MRNRRLGLIVNPVAGMGGRVGLKGTDGVQALRRARKLGALPETPRRTIEALRVVGRIKDELDLLTYPGEMGENEAYESGFSPVVVGSLDGQQTTSADTRRAAKEMLRSKVDLLLFAGGDGTARDICEVVAQTITVLGIPAGVKMYSGVYATTPRHAGESAVTFLEEGSRKVREAEVMDIDEESFRRGVVSARLYGYMRVPEDRRFIQSVKSGRSPGEAQAIKGISDELLDSMERDSLYIFGPGTTTRDILAQLGLEKTLLGVDVVQNRKVIARDVNERQLAALMVGRRSRIVVTVVGGQGFIFGRGNQQFSPDVLRRVGRENIILVATKEKLSTLAGRPLLVDTGDEGLDATLQGYWRVVTSFRDYTMYRAEG